MDFRLISATSQSSCPSSPACLAQRPSSSTSPSSVSCWRGEPYWRPRPSSGWSPCKGKRGSYVYECVGAVIIPVVSLQCLKVNRISLRCEMRQQSHKKCHEDVRQCLLGLETKVSECAAEQVTSYEKCVGQQNAARVGLI